MGLLILSFASLALAALTYIPAINWVCLVGFAFGLTAWVGGRKIWQTDRLRKSALPAMILGIAGTAANLFGILVAFVLTTLLVGGTSVVF